jgi:hypothetical protein
VHQVCTRRDVEDHHDHHIGGKKAIVRENLGDIAHYLAVREDAGPADVPILGNDMMKDFLDPRNTGGWVDRHDADYTVFWRVHIVDCAHPVNHSVLSAQRQHVQPMYHVRFQGDCERLSAGEGVDASQSAHLRIANKQGRGAGHSEVYVVARLESACPDSRRGRRSRLPRELCLYEALKEDFKVRESTVHKAAEHRSP